MNRRIDIKEYQYHLPEEKIATFPTVERDSSKLLVYKNGDITQDIFRNIDNYLPADCLLVRNNTRVIRARLLFKTGSGSPIEIFLLEAHQLSIEQALQQTKGPIVFQCLIGNKRKWKQDSLTLLHRIDKKDILLEARFVGETDDAMLVEFIWSNETISFGKLLEEFGRIPLPPYIKRGTVDDDSITYQTTYSKIEGSVAAPTAGLHFTDEVQKQLQEKGIDIADVTLHVGAGTFKPMKVDDASDHIMHSEEIIVSKSFLEKLLAALQEKKKIVAVGTTSLRTLETLYGWGLPHLNPLRQLAEGLTTVPNASLSTTKKQQPSDAIVNGEKTIGSEETKSGDSKSPSANWRRGFRWGSFSLSQWELYEVKKIPATDSIQALLNYMKQHNLEHVSGKTQLMIVPGFQFQIVGALITNFHQPGSTLLMLVAAFIGDDWKRVYDFAMQNHFRFLSYGDSSLLWKSPT